MYFEDNDENDCNKINTIPSVAQFPHKQCTILVEGNIGSGKSTFLQYFTKSDKVEVFFEPVDKWKDVYGSNMLDLMYKDAKKWSFTFQSYVQLTMLMNHSKQSKKPIRLLERSIYSANYCFIENLRNNNLLQDFEYAILTEWFTYLCQNVKADLIVYLQADPQSCLDRLKKRNRHEETKVSLEYLQDLHVLHEDWLINQKKYKLPCPVLVLDASKSLPELQVEIESRRQDILCGM